MWPFDYQMVMHGGQSRRKRLCRDQQNDYCAIAALCHNLLISILLLLPAKTLVELKLVSKEFRDVISSPLFSILHVQTHHKDKQSFAPTSLYFYSSFSTRPEICSVGIFNHAKTIPSLSVFRYIAYATNHQFKIVQSCNGLLLCSFEDASSLAAREYFVCNPTTHAYTMLPELPRVESSSSKSKNKQEICHPVLTLAFDPLQTHVYKVFAIRVMKQLARKCTCEVLVYSSDKGGRVWRKSGCQFIISPSMKRIHHGVFHDGGNITWICETGFIYFNVKTENLIEVPKVTMRSSAWRKIRFFGESIDGGLQLIKPIPGSGIEVCQLRPGTSYWEHRCTLFPQYGIYERHLPILLDNYMRNPRYSLDMYQILAVDTGKKQLIVAIAGMVIGYCQQSRKSWVIQPMPQRFCENFTFGYVNSFQFVETLSPV